MRSDGDQGISSATLGRALAWLVKQGDVGEKQIVHQRGKPKVYWLAYKASEGSAGGGSVYFDQTTSLSNNNDRNKSECETMASENGAAAHKAERIERLVSEGMSVKWARAEVMGEEL